MLFGFFRPRPFPLPFCLFPCFPSDFGTQLSAVPFSLRCLASQCYLSVSTSSFRFRPLPFAFALGSVTRLGCPYLKVIRSLLTYVRRELCYTNTASFICQHLFSKFFNKFYFFFLCTYTKTLVLATTNISPFSIPKLALWQGEHLQKTPLSKSGVFYII